MKLKSKPLWRQKLPRSPLFKKIRFDECARIRWARNLSTLLKAKVPLAVCLDTLALQEKNRTTQWHFHQLAHSIRAGQPLSLCLSQFPKMFDPFFIQLIKAGELSGNLSQALSRIASYKEQKRRVLNKTKAAITYPAVILAVSTVLITLLMALVIPRFEALYADILKGTPLPVLTASVLKISYLFKNYFIGILASCVLVFSSSRLGLLENTFPWFWNRLVLKLPRIGELSVKWNTLLFTQTLCTLLKSGVPILESLQSTKNAMINPYLSASIDRARLRLEQGEGLADSLEKETPLPILATSMLMVGEKSGMLPETLEHITDTYEEEVQNELNVLTALIEPAMIVILAVLVGTLVIALFLPLVGLIENLAMQ